MVPTYHLARLHSYYHRGMALLPPGLQPYAGRDAVAAAGIGDGRHEADEPLDQ
jgi:hypothetical protein